MKKSNSRGKKVKKYGTMAIFERKKADMETANARKLSKQVKSKKMRAKIEKVELKAKGPK